MLMDKAHPSRWWFPKSNNAQRPTLNTQRSIQNGRVERWTLSVERWAFKQLLTHLQNVGQRPLPFVLRVENRRRSFLLLATSIVMLAVSASATLSSADAQRIGKKIWQNECNGTIAGLTSWNTGENFASLGIGHFIWYPEDAKGPFEESFPKLLTFMESRGTKPTGFLATNASRHCPWKNRAEFLSAQNTPKMKELRSFLAETVDVQSEFLVDRLSRSLPKMLAEAAPQHQESVRANFNSLLTSSQGCYALVDYVNFKGEGVLHSERYQGQGWGLLQVLEEMKTGSSSAVQEFSRAATVVLKRRVANAPPARNEQRWLAGWLKRVNSYSRD
jgi:hypothetical protein